MEQQLAEEKVALKERKAEVEALVKELEIRGKELARRKSTADVSIDC